MAEAIYSELAPGREPGSHCHSGFGRDSKAGRGVERFIVEKGRIQGAVAGGG